MQNSLYGKLSQDIENYYDYKIVPGGTLICYDFAPSKSNVEICAACGENAKDHGWRWQAEFGELEIQARPSLFRYQYQYGEEWKGRGLFNNVATGASITGFTRAHLLRAMCLVGRENVIYCDTDSLMIRENADCSAIPLSKKLGEWECEDECAPKGYFAGKKLYGIKTSKLDDDGGPIYKVASKGSKLDYDQLQKIVSGEKVIWQNPAPSFSIVSGKAPLIEFHDENNYSEAIDASELFVEREIRQTAITPLADRKVKI